MKSFFTYLLLLTGSTVLAQTSAHANLNTEINDDDKALTMRIDGDRSGKEIHYNRTFNVVGMSREQKDALKNRVLDSLGLGEAPPKPVQPTGAVTSGTVKVTFVCPTCTGKTKLSVNGDGFSAEREVEIDKQKSGFPFELAMPPGAYQYTYWQNGVEQMRLPFTVKDGKETTVTVK